MSDYAWMVMPAGIGLISIWINVILGLQVLRRGVIFIDLAMAQVAAVGILCAELWFAEHGQSFWWAMGAAWGMTLMAAGLLCFLERWVREHLEACIGLLYVVAACAAMLLVLEQPHGKERVEALFNGRLLWTDAGDVSPVLLMAILLAVVLRWRKEWLSGRTFYFLFAVAIPPLVINLGVYLEFAALIVPALAMSLMPAVGRTGLGCSIGTLALMVGFVLSVRWDWPIGPAVVLTMIACAFPVVLGVRLGLKWRAKDPLSYH